MYATVIAHGDLDGLASAAVIMAALKHHWNINSRLEIAQPYNLHKKLAGLLSQTPDLLLIVDLGLDEATWTSTSEKLKKLLSAGCSVMWIDHHVNTVKHAPSLVSLGVALLFTSKGCASTLAGRIFAPRTDEPAFFSKLAKLGEVADNVTVESRELTYVADRLVAALSAPSAKIDFKRKIVRLWLKKHKLLDDEVVIKAEEFDKLISEELTRINERVVLELKKGIVIDARDVKLKGLAGHVASRIASEKGKVTIVVFTPNEREVVATCRVPHNQNFNAVAALLRIARKLGGGGGGLSKAAAIRVPRQAGDELLKELGNLFRRILD